MASSLDTWLVPHVGLFAAGGSAGATTLGGLSLRVPRTLSMRRALKGIPVTVRVPGAGVVRAEVRAARLRGVKRGLIARKTRRATEAGALRVRLKPSRKARRALLRKRLVVATVRVTVAGQTPQTASAAIRLRR